MFPLSDGILYRINKDGTRSEPIQTTNSILVFGTSPLYDYHIRDVDPNIEIKCEISTDEFGRVNLQFFILNGINI